MDESKRNEIKNLIARGTFRVIVEEDIPQDGNCMPGKVVLSIKANFDGKIKYKARYVIGMYLDKLKKLMVHTKKTLKS